MSSNGELKVVPSVFACVHEKGKVLLLRRANTGWLDGWYDLPAGHLEDQEKFKDGAIRELFEETSLRANVADLKLIHLYQNHHNPKSPHYGYIFLVKHWQGEPKIMEPNKCDDMDFFSLDKLPGKLAPYAKAAVENIAGAEVTISFHPPGSIK